MTHNTEHETILAKLRALVETLIEEKDKDMLDVASITGETHLLSLPLDSLAIMELMLGIEDTFKVYIPEDKAFQFVTVNDVIAYVQDKLAAKAQRAAAKQAQTA